MPNFYCSFFIPFFFHIFLGTKILLNRLSSFGFEAFGVALQAWRTWQTKNTCQSVLTIISSFVFNKRIFFYFKRYISVTAEV